MTYFLLALALIGAVLLVYAMWLRPWLKTKTWAQGFFAWIEPFEVAVFKKSETMLVSRLLELGSLIVGGYDSIAIFATSYDMTPITTRLFDLLHVAPDLRGVAMAGFVFALARIMSFLRKRTTKPLEVVAVASKDVTPAVAQALVAAEVSKDEAVAAVNDAKAA
ncbi:hypothetical protein [Tardiphaga sp. 709]|uniref:hypothetical protein n=1 Tax=Tardiphaga sp. 709 TaxID=3076039 RepID=UPI0028EFC019|nr:hypothetical protein [Tardiphaga sp. 709]WNV09942.1 hypothetical protein RSO67_01735 [Tardiphaga sp. 709]